MLQHLNNIHDMSAIHLLVVSCAVATSSRNISAMRSPTAPTGLTVVPSLPLGVIHASMQGQATSAYPVLGEGAYGAVVLMHQEHGPSVAVKIPQDYEAEGAQVRELLMGIKLHECPDIVKIAGLSTVLPRTHETAGTPGKVSTLAIMYELCNNGTLHTIRRGSSLKDVVSAVADVATGMSRQCGQYHMKPQLK
jgi:hypothetical protein